MRQRTRARRGGGIPPTKYRAADGGCSAREESRFSPKGATNTCAVCPAPEGALRGHGRGRQPSGTLLGEADCTGLDPEAVYVYGERVEGRARLPPQRASTVAPTVTARCQANQHCKHNTPAQNSTLYHQSNAKQIWYNSNIKGREAGKSCENQALSRSRQSRNAAPAHNLKYPRKRGKEEK